MFNRRRFLTGSTLAAAGAVSFPHVAQPAGLFGRKRGPKPKYIIHLVSDGMSMGTLTCADHLSERLRGRGLTWTALNNQPEIATGWMNMRSLNSLVTDSSAASSSWGSGTRIINGRVNQLGDGTPLKTIYELFGEQGWKRGLVTTTEITHATPAGFAACIANRDLGDRIAVQYLERHIDVLLGGGQKFFEPRRRRDRRDLKGDFAKAGYTVMTDRDQFLAAPKDTRWLGIFSDSHLPFTVDRRQSEKLQATVPTLAELTQAALAKLVRERNFILQVEGGRVDHGCHNDDAAGALYDQIAFDEAIDVVVAFQKKHPETLVVITTDHGNANLGLNGAGSGYGQSNNRFYNLLEARASFSEMMKRLKRRASPSAEADADDDDSDSDDADRPQTRRRGSREIIASPEEIVTIIGEGTGYKVPLKKAQMFRPFLTKQGDCLYDAMKSDLAQLGQLMGNYWGIGFTGTAHTADYVPVTAMGPGADRFRGFIQNTDVFRHYTTLAGIDFVNPSEPLITGLGPEAGSVERIAEYARV